MLGEKVKINVENNFYDGMDGIIIEEHPCAIKVRIDFSDDYDDVMFYKDQVMLIK